jgi:hypothetical protein
MPIRETCFFQLAFAEDWRLQPLRRMPAQFDPDPPRKWRRKLYDESKLAGLSRRDASALETDRDMNKSVEQLVCDVHEETHDPGRTPLDNIAGAQKRTTSMLARVALSSEKVAARMLALTWAIGVLTLIIVILGAIAAWPVIREWLPKSTEKATSPLSSASAAPTASVAPSP